MAALRFCGGILLALLVAEALLRLLPVSSATHTGYHLDPHILAYPAQLRFTNAAGWDLRDAQTYTTNNLGFVAHRDFLPDPKAVAVIGDSHIEQNYLPMALRLDTQLEQRLAGRPVYGMGVPGTSLLDYAERIRYAYQHLNIRTMVLVLEDFDIDQALCGSGNTQAWCIAPESGRLEDAHQSTPGLAKRLLRESALAQYLFSQIKLSPDALRKALAPQPPKTPAKTGRTPMAPATYQAIREAFFARLADLPELKLTIALAPGNRYLKPAEEDILPFPMAQFVSDCTARGWSIVDPTPTFRDYRRHTGLTLDVSPSDRHWNRAAVEHVASALAARL